MSSTVEPSRFPGSNPSKRRKVETLSDRSPASTSTKDNVPWRSESQRRIYSTKLVEALFRARNRSVTDSPGEPSAPSSRGDVRSIADRVLATAAKGRMRWSRAILGSRRVRMTTALGKRRHRRSRPAAPAGGGIRSGKGRQGKMRTRTRMRMLPAVERRVKVLGRLVPGCRGASVTSLLEEATDYIAALEMQVKAMTALSELLGSSSSR